MEAVGGDEPRLTRRVLQYGGSAAEATPDIRMLFIRKVCIIL